MSRRRSRLFTALAALALAVPGCRAYDARYSSFPLNSIQMIDNGAYYNWTFGKALGVEFAFQVFPWIWVASIVDIFLLPITGALDVVALVADKRSEPYEEQIAERKRRGIEHNAFKSAEDAARSASVKEGRSSPSLSPTAD